MQKGLGMSLIVKGSDGKDRELCSTGTIQAVLTHVFDIGVQPTKYGDKHQLIMSFELNENMSDGRPFMLSKTVNHTLGSEEHPSIMADIIVALRGSMITPQDREDGIDISSYIGCNLFLNIAQNTKANGGEGRRIMSYMALPKGVPPIQIRFPMPSDSLQAWIQRERDKSIQNTAPKAPILSAPRIPQDDIPF